MRTAMRLARLHYALDSVPTASSGALHVLFELPDYLGSTSIVIDQGTSELVEAATYLPFGGDESTYRPARWAAFREDYGFTGKEAEVELGLQYFGKRFLSAALGRWVSADPASVHGLGADLNVYAYVHGLLLRSTDPVGLDEDASHGEKVVPETTTKTASGTTVVTGGGQPGGAAYRAADTKEGPGGTLQVGEIIILGHAPASKPPSGPGLGAPSSTGQSLVEVAAERANQENELAVQFMSPLAGARVSEGYIFGEGEQSRRAMAGFVGNTEAVSTSVAVAVPGANNAVPVRRAAAASAPIPRTSTDDPVLTLRGTNRASSRGVVTDRGTFWKQTISDAWEDATPGPNGGRLCPTCGKEVFAAPGSQSLTAR